MVRGIKYTKAFFRLIRIQNLLIIASTMYVIRWLIVIPFLKKDGFDSQLPEFLFSVLVLSTMLVAAAGYVINDYFDRKADLINRPGKVILGRILNRRVGMFWHITLSAAGIIGGTYVSYAIGHLKYGVLFILVSGVLWFYSTTYKRQVLLGNIIVAILVALVPFVVLLYEIPLVLKEYQLYLDTSATNIKIMAVWVAGFSIFAFLLTLMREIVKDLEDFEGDFAFGKNTVPVAWGAAIAKKIIIVISTVCCFLLGLALFHLQWSQLTLIYGILFVILPLLFFSFKIWKATKKEDYHKVSIYLKLTMLAGIFYSVIASNWVF